MNDLCLCLGLRLSLSLRLDIFLHPRRLLQHGFGYTAQDVDFFLRDRSAVEQLVQARHKLLGSERVQKAQRLQRFLPMRQHACDLRRIGRRAVRRSAGQGKAAQGQPPFIGNNLQGRSDIERAKLWIGRNTQAHMAAVHVLIAHAKALRSEEKGNALRKGLGRA